MKPSPIRFIIFIFLSLLSKVALPQCNTPVITSISNIFYNNVQVNYTCCMSGTYYLEYGNTGFTPGTGATPGLGGTVIQGSPNPGSQMIPIVNSYSLHDVYVRVECAVGGWTPNSMVKTFRPGIPCSSAQQITCGSLYSVGIPAGIGSWSNYSCDNSGTLGREGLYKYTATVSGLHYFYVGTSSGNTNRVNFRYRIDSLPCNENNWICLTTASPNNPVTLQFGPLLAGKTYYFLADAQVDTIPSNPVSFRIECPVINCPSPTGINISRPFFGQVKVEFTSSNTTYFEFGPVGFTPGNFSIAGAGGTLLQVNSGAVISGYGLTTGVSYIGYLRSRCQQGNAVYFSQNVGFYFNVGSCPTTYFYNPAYTGFYVQFNQPTWWPPTNNYDIICSGIGITQGTDMRLQYLCTKTGYYNALFSVSPNNIKLGVKPYSSNCLPSSYSCPSAIPGSGISYASSLGLFLKDSIYDLVLNANDTMPSTVYLRIECDAPTNITTSNISPHGFDLNWSCSCLDTVFIEIGPEGFNPGTGYAPGSYGTIILASGNSHTISNLTPFTKYDVYLRTGCGTFFTPNKKVTVFTPKECSNAPALVCGDNVNHYYNSSMFYYPTGPWSVQSCNGGNLNGEEYIYQFTPTQTGMYKIQVYGYTAGWNWLFSTNYFYKHDSLGCNPNNWNCIGEVGNTSPPFIPKEFLFGPLTAGETYYIMTDGVGATLCACSYKYFARLLCQGVCSGVELTAAYPLHPDGVLIYAPYSSGFVGIILEIGPQGFTPGTDTLPGNNGTVYQNVTFPFSITGLTSGTTYDVYARSNCFADTTGFTTGFSANFGPLSFTPCGVAPDPITTSGNNTTVCSGDSVILYRNGGVPAPGTIYRWYENGCGFGNFLGTGDSMIVTPVNSTTYFLRAEAPCGNTSCVSKYIQVNNSVPVITGNTQLCPGDTAVLGTQISYSQYLWSTGDTTASISVTTGGIYGVTVTNSSGCQVYGTVQVVAIPFTPPQISGDLELCGSDSSTLFAGSGFSSYLWSTGSTASFITVADSGIYSVNVSNQYGCMGFDSVMVNLHHPPQVNISAVGNLSFCLGDSVLMVVDTGLAGWQWYRNGMMILGANNPQYWIKTSGSYCCIGADIYECSDTSNVLIAYTPCIVIGAPQEKLGDVPPFDAQILTDHSNEFSILRIQCPVSDPVDIKVFDSLGKQVTVSAEQIHFGDYSLHLSVPSGLYFVQIHCGNEVRNLKLLK